MYTDPTGHFWWLIIGALIGAVIGGAAAAASGGNAGAGALVGAVTGFIGAGLATFVAGSMMMAASSAASWGGAMITPMEGGIITGAEFAIAGFAGGIATGYAGGKGDIGDVFTQAGIGAAIGFGSGFCVGYSYTAGWQSVVHGADTQAANSRNRIAQAYEAKIRALRADCITRPDKVNVVVGSRYLATSSGGPGTSGFKHRFAGLGDTWEMGPYGPNKLIATSDTAKDLLSWGTHVTTQRAISTGAFASHGVMVSASGLKESMALYNQFWAGQPYQAFNRNSNYAVNTVIYGSGGDVPNDLGFTPGFPGSIS